MFVPDRLNATKDDLSERLHQHTDGGSILRQRGDTSEQLADSRLVQSSKLGVASVGSRRASRELLHKKGDSVN